MDSSTRYVPVLKGRDGEYGALQTLSESVWHVLTPVLELPPIPWDFEADRPARSIDAHLKKVGQKIERAWGTDRDIFVDLIWISETERMANSQHPLDFVFSALRARSVKAVPVIGLVRGDEYLRACRSIIGQDRRGVCLRIQREDFVDFPDTRSRIEEVMRSVDVSAGGVDLLLDLRSLTQRSIEAVGVFQLIPVSSFGFRYRGSSAALRNRTAYCGTCRPAAVEARHGFRARRSSSIGLTMMKSSQRELPMDSGSAAASPAGLRDGFR